MSEPLPSQDKARPAAWPFWYWLAAIGALGLLARMPVVAAIAAEPDRAILASDSWGYLELGQRLAVMGRFSSTAPEFTPEVVRTPGYPALIALLALVGGPQPILPLVVAQAILGAGIAVGVVLLGRKLFGVPAGILAGALYALAPISIIMTGFIYAETLFAAWLVGGALLAIHAPDRDRFALSVAGGLAFGLATLTRPIGLPLAPLLASIPVTSSPSPSGAAGGKVGRGLRHAAALLAGFLIVVAPWMARNAAYGGRFSVSAISDINLFYYNAASLEAHRLGLSIDEARSLMDRRLAAQPPVESGWPGEQAGRLARQVILAHPLAFAWYNGLDALNGLRPGFSFLLRLVDGEAPVSLESLRTALGQPAPILLIELVMLAYVVLLVVGSAIGLLALIRQREWRAIVLLGLIPAWLLYLPGLASNARFRAPVEPLLAILAAVGLLTVGRLARSRRREIRAAG